MVFPVTYLPRLHALTNPCSVQPLAECFRYALDSGNAIKLMLVDTWMREYQVLPMRTHPEMMMSSGGGYLLTGIRVVKDEAKAAVAAQPEAAPQDTSRNAKRQRT